MVANGNACETNKFWGCTAKLLHILAVHHRRFGGAPPNWFLVVVKIRPIWRCLFFGGGNLRKKTIQACFIMVIQYITNMQVVTT
jgi:hypothetical protein